MLMLATEPASKFSSLDLARLVTRVNEGYPMPVRMEAGTLEALVRERDLDLARSPVMFVDGRASGLALVGHRGTEGYLAEIGVVPEARGRGAGRALLDAALAALRDAGAASCRLEVLEDNQPALAMYREAGFHATRELPGYETHRLVARNVDLKEAPLASVRARVRRDAAWPNAFASAQHAAARAWTSEAGYAVARPGEQGLVVFEVGGPDPGGVLDGLGAVFPGAASYLNVCDARVEAELARRGWQRGSVNVEMIRPVA